MVLVSLATKHGLVTVVATMNNNERTETPAESALNKFRNEVRARPPQSCDLVDLERRLQELLNVRGCEIMAEIMKVMDTDAPEVEINGEHWGNRRVVKAEYQTVFGPVEVERSIYQRAGRGRVAVPM